MAANCPPITFNIYKPVGMGSFDVVRQLKRHLPKGIKKIGHFGTLDPFAEGVLLIGMNGAARLNNFVHDLLPKTYLATGKIGVQTSTGDIEGEVIKDSACPQMDLEAWQKLGSEKFLGDYLQSPHAYSSAKHQGKSLHAWARDGVIVVKDPVLRHVHELKVLSLVDDEITFSVTVSSGTYIRVLFEEWASYAGTCGHLLSLKRTAVGPHKASESVKQEEWPKDGQLWDLRDGMLPEELIPLDSIVLQEFGSKLYANGQRLEQQKHLDHLSEIPNNPFWVKSPKGVYLGIGEMRDEKLTPLWSYPDQ